MTDFPVPCAYTSPLSWLPTFSFLDDMTWFMRCGWKKFHHERRKSHTWKSSFMIKSSFWDHHHHLVWNSFHTHHPLTLRHLKLHNFILHFFSFPILKFMDVFFPLQWRLFSLIINGLSYFPFFYFLSFVWVFKELFSRRMRRGRRIRSNRKWIKKKA